MKEIHVEYLDFLLEDEEIAEIEQISVENDIDVKFHPKKSKPMNAALDELVNDIIVFVRSDGFQAAKDAIEFSTCLYSLIEILKSKVKNKKMKKVTPRKIEDKKINIGVKVDNVDILLPEKGKEKDVVEYLAIALKEAGFASSKTRKMIVVEKEKNNANVLFVEEYAKKKIGMEYYPIKIIPLKKEKHIVKPIKVRRAKK